MSSSCYLSGLVLSLPSSTWPPEGCLYSQGKSIFLLNALSPTLRQATELVFVFLLGLEFEPQGFALAKQALYHLSYSSNLFCSGYFGDWGGGPLELFSWAGLEL
jgi:hypothetical protein